MPSNAVMRAALKDIYLRPNWHEKVDAMSDKQAAAVYQRFLSEKKLK